MWAPYTNGMSYGLTTPAPGVQDWQVCVARGRALHWAA
jgi:hypothetical protein